MNDPKAPQLMSGHAKIHPGQFVLLASYCRKKEQILQQDLLPIPVKQRHHGRQATAQQNRLAEPNGLPSGVTLDTVEGSGG